MFTAFNAYIEEQKQAIAEGWRTFRVTSDLSDKLPNEIVCPNTTKAIQCADCGLCSGMSTRARNIVIEVHGAKKKKFVKHVNKHYMLYNLTNRKMETSHLINYIYWRLYI